MIKVRIASKCRKSVSLASCYVDDVKNAWKHASRLQTTARQFVVQRYNPVIKDWVDMGEVRRSF